MKFFILIFVFFVSVSPLLAADAQAPITEMSADQKKLVRNSRLVRLCNQAAANYVQPDGVEYMPGIDAKGNFIAAPDIGIDLRGSDFPIFIPIEVDLLERFNLDVPLGIIADAEVAGIQIYEDGKVTYNGHDISSNVNTFCREHHLIKAHTVPAQNLPDSDK